MDYSTPLDDSSESSSRGHTPVPDILDEKNSVLSKRRGGQLLNEMPHVANIITNTADDDDDDDGNDTSSLLSDGDFTYTPTSRLHEDTKHQCIEQTADGSDDTVKLTDVETFLAAQIVVKPKTGIERFRALVNMVKNNLKWARALEGTETRSTEVHHLDGEETLTFNVDAFKANVQSVNPLTPELKMILCTNSWNRTPQNIKSVYKFLNKLKFFDKYTHMIKMELASVLYYETFEDGRILVKQGHPGRSFYYILSGSVIIDVTEEDKRTGETKTQFVGETPAGSAFGELALLHETKRTATIVCKGDSEFLRVDKPDFDMVLRRSYQQEWETRMNALRSLNTFGDWSDEELTSTNDRCRFQEYPPNTVILSDPEQAPDHIYFIKSGECKIVREVTILKSHLPFGHVKLSLPPHTPDLQIEPSFKTKKNEQLCDTALHICTFGEGHFFGVGEDLRKTHIMSVGKVECILVSRVAFLFHEHGKCMEPMKRSVEELMPSREEAFNSYIEGIKWRSYKRNLVKELVNRRHIPNTTTIFDVPLVLRREAQR